MRILKSCIFLLACSSAFAQDGECGISLPGIHEDLSPWALTGINASHVDAMKADLKIPGSESGKCGVMFYILNQKLYVDTKSSKKTICSGAGEDFIAVYVVVLKRMLLRHRVKDTVFVVSMGDFPDDDTTNRPWKSKLLLPILRFCRTYDSPDILVPIHYAWLERWYDIVVPDTPFEERYDRVKSGFSRWGHMPFRSSTIAMRWNENNVVDYESRLALERWANSTGDPTYAINDKYEPMSEWHRYRYIAHLDGLTCSAKFEKSFLTGSLVFVEESGFISFAKRQMQPYVHYIPFFRHFPQELEDVTAWARRNPEVAASIAVAGSRLVRDATTLDALECHLVLVLREYTKLLTFAPEAADGVVSADYYLTHFIGHLHTQSDVDAFTDRFF